jgi:hypothetical protein
MPLCAAIVSGQMEGIRFALERGANPLNNIDDIIDALEETILEDNYNEKLCEEMFNLLMKNVDIRTNRDKIYICMVTCSPTLALKLLKDDPDYTDIDEELIQIIIDTIDHLNHINKRSDNIVLKSFIPQISEAFNILKNYILVRTHVELLESPNCSDESKYSECSDDSDSLYLE